MGRAFRWLKNLVGPANTNNWQQTKNPVFLARVVTYGFQKGVTKMEKQCKRLNSEDHKLICDWNHAVIEDPENCNSGVCPEGFKR